MLEGKAKKSFFGDLVHLGVLLLETYRCNFSLNNKM